VKSADAAIQNAYSIRYRRIYSTQLTSSSFYLWKKASFYSLDSRPFYSVDPCEVDQIVNYNILSKFSYLKQK